MIKICEQCNTEFKVKPFRFLSAKYCSWDCKHKAMNPIPKDMICTVCGKEFGGRGRRRDAKFCSHSCHSKSRKGETSPNWKGGTSLTNIRALAGGGIKKWRYAVYQRDNYTCQHCFTRGVTIHAHHIKPVSNYPENMLDIENGITLCVSCHSAVHGKAIPESKPRYKKICSECGKITKGFSNVCLSCASKKRHKASNNIGV